MVGIAFKVIPIPKDWWRFLTLQKRFSIIWRSNMEKLVNIHVPYLTSVLLLFIILLLLPFLLVYPFNREKIFQLFPLALPSYISCWLLYFSPQTKIYFIFNFLLAASSVHVFLKYILPFFLGLKCANHWKNKDVEHSHQWAPSSLYMEEERKERSRETEIEGVLWKHEDNEDQGSGTKRKNKFRKLHVEGKNHRRGMSTMKTGSGTSFIFGRYISSIPSYFPDDHQSFKQFITAWWILLSLMDMRSGSTNTKKIYIN